jgi:protease IV
VKCLGILQIQYKLCFDRLHQTKANKGNEMNDNEPLNDLRNMTEPTLSAASATPSAPQSAPTWERNVLEKLATASLKEQQLARRWKIFFRLAFLIALLLIAFALLRPKGHATDHVGPHTALVELNGEIAMGTSASAENINAALKEAFEDPDSKGVVLRINSPGGSPVQSGLINSEITRLKTLHKKPIYVVVEEICASGGYYVASAADQIFVDKASLVGSIGVLMDGFGFTGLMDKLGVERRLLTAGENKGFLDPFSPQSEKHKAYVESMLKEIHQQFIATVKQGRGVKLKTDQPDIFSGLVFSGEKSITLGLADATGTLDSVARDVVKAEKVIDYTPKENVLDRITRRFGAAAGDAVIKAMRASSGSLR